jgi:hypothetical protein
VTKYLIDEQLLDERDEGFEQALEDAKASQTRPLCRCTMPGAPMYIAKVSGRLILKRMPGTGGNHSPTCDSFEPPPELSGLGEVMGSAIQEDPSNGTTALKLDFSLTKTGGRAPPVADGEQADSVASTGKKLTLRGTLHYLWDQAGFNKWSPAMANKRHWHTIHRYLLQAAEGKVSKGTSLPDMLYVPEPFHVDHKDEIAARLAAVLAKAAPVPGKASRRLMLAVGEVKEIAQARYGHKIIFKQVPTHHFMLDEDLHKRLVKRFESERALWNTVEDSHLMAIATFSVGTTGIASIEEMALMPVTTNWLPFESNYELALIEAMTNSGRRFTKGLRYNLSSKRPLACLIASDTQPHPTALYILPPGATEEDDLALQQLIAESNFQTWVWRTASGAMPPLPPKG